MSSWNEKAQDLKEDNVNILTYIFNLKIPTLPPNRTKVVVQGKRILLRVDSLPTRSKSVQNNHFFPHTKVKKMPGMSFWVHSLMQIFKQISTVLSNKSNLTWVGSKLAQTEEDIFVFPLPQQLALFPPPPADCWYLQHPLNKMLCGAREYRKMKQPSLCGKRDFAHLLAVSHEMWHIVQKGFLTLKAISDTTATTDPTCGWPPMPFKRRIWPFKNAARGPQCNVTRQCPSICLCRLLQHSKKLWGNKITWFLLCHGPLATFSNSFLKFFSKIVSGLP